MLFAYIDAPDSSVVGRLGMLVAIEAGETCQEPVDECPDNEIVGVRLGEIPGRLLNRSALELLRGFGEGLWLMLQALEPWTEKRIRIMIGKTATLYGIGRHD